MQVSYLSTEAKGAIACSTFAPLNLGASSYPSPQARDDRILDLNGHVYRVQVKYATRTMSTNSISVHLCSMSNNQYIHPSYSTDDIDVAVTYLPEIDQLL